MFNKLRIIQGANMVEYVIPVALIAIVSGITLYSMYENGLLAKFIASSSGNELSADGTKITLNSYGDNSTDSSTGSGPLVETVGSLGKPTLDTNAGTDTDTGVEKTTDPPSTGVDCKDGMCSFTVGEYTLTGVPEDFSSFVETNGTSPTSTEIAMILKQILDQMEADANPDEDILKMVFQNLINRIGLPQKGAVDDGAQYAAFQNITEFLLTDNPGSFITPDPAGLNNYEARTQTYFSSSDLNNILLSLDPKNSDPSKNIDNILNDELANLDIYMDEASKATGKDYTELRKVVGSLVDVSKTINKSFYTSVSSGETDIKVIKQHVASSIEDMNAVNIYNEAIGQ